MKNLRFWCQSWIPTELCGGVAGKGIHDVHANLFADLQHSRETSGHFAGCKADVRRCFDSVDVPMALRVWKHLGAPSGVLHVLLDFYNRQPRWFSVRNCISPRAVFAKRSLLQGCPASPALLNSLMTVWVAALKTKVPIVKLAIYLGDRSVWATDCSAAKHVHEAMLCAQFIDTALGFSLHPDKLESFALRESGRRFLNLKAGAVGPARVSLKLLGIQYAVGARVRCHQDDNLHKSILNRCRKIRLVSKNMGTPLLGRCVFEHVEVSKTMVFVGYLRMLVISGSWAKSSCHSFSF